MFKHMARLFKEDLGFRPNWDKVKLYSKTIGMMGLVFVVVAILAAFTASIVPNTVFGALLWVFGIMFPLAGIGGYFVFLIIRASVEAEFELDRNRRNW